MRRTHLHTDIGGDTDDLCTLAMLLGWPGVELAGVTTCSYSGGMRAGLARYALKLAGGESASVVAGADGSLGGYSYPHGVSDLGCYWPEPVAPEPSPPGAALDLLARSVEMGAAIVGVGPWTNLALLEVAQRRLLASTQLVLMGGYVRAIQDGAAGLGTGHGLQRAAGHARCEDRVGAVRPAGCAALRYSGCNLARGAPAPGCGRAACSPGSSRIKASFMALTETRTVWDASIPGYPTTSSTSTNDPLACAVAACWVGVRVEELRLSARSNNGLLAFRESPSGKPSRVVTGIDGPRLEREWMEAVGRAGW